MADTAYYLDEEDRDFLDFLYRQYGMEKRTRTRPETRNPRSRSPYQPPLEATHPGPKVYVALTPSGGIPALSAGALTGTGSADFEDDVPGEAECEIYRIDETPGTAGSAAMVGIPGLTKTVYNISTTAISGYDWVKVSRTESGAWVADKPGAAASGGSGTPETALLTGSEVTISTPAGTAVLTLELTSGHWMVAANLMMSFTGNGTGTDYGGYLDVEAPESGNEFLGATDFYVEHITGFSSGTRYGSGTIVTHLYIPPTPGTVTVTLYGYYSASFLTVKAILSAPTGPWGGSTGTSLHAWKVAA